MKASNFTIFKRWACKPHTVFATVIWVCWFLFVLSWLGVYGLGGALTVAGFIAVSSFLRFHENVRWEEAYPTYNMVCNLDAMRAIPRSGQVIQLQLGQDKNG